MATDILDVIRTKRDGGTLSDEQVRFFIEGYTAGTIADEQAAALCMAILLRDMGSAELATWTQAMIDSGERLDLSGVGRPTVDKHSTGGVGDKVSLPLAPLVAACGAAVPQLSGRGLGHTGGTLDKLEAIPGWRATLPTEQVVAQLRDVGAVICAASETLCPADRKLYALRDVTATVEAMPLIASSIMSKKIAEGTEALVLDVKVGSGAFLPEIATARRLAETMVGLGTAHGVRTVALITDMEAPLGRACGNGLEVLEALEVLRGGGPADLVEVTVALAREMLRLAGLPADAEGGPRAALSDGRALAVWDAMIRAQGGDPDADLPAATVHHEVRASDGRLPAPPRRPGGGRGRVAAGGRPVAQGGPGVAVRRRDLPAQARRSGRGGRAGAGAARRRRGPAAGGARRARGSDRGRARAARTPSARARAHRLTGHGSS